MLEPWAPWVARLVFAFILLVTYPKENVLERPTDGFFLLHLTLVECTRCTSLMLAVLDAATGPKHCKIIVPASESAPCAEQEAVLETNL
jgi:hypothetical protein